MSWIPTTLVSGWQSIFHVAGKSQSNLCETTLEDIRKAMLNELGVSSAVETSRLELRVTNADDLQDLWYLRGDVMATIAAADGEAHATQRLSAISHMFSGLLPTALASRPHRQID